MATKSEIIWSIKEFTEMLRKRQLNKFDCNIGVSGKRGNGKSTFLFKVFNSFKRDGFNQERHQVYSRDDVISLLSTQKFSFCWDDEAINSGYKREFQNKGQQELIKIITNYRDSFNIYASALPFFYSLDKGLRELIFVHVHIIERGFAVILLPLGDSIHSQDPWDTKINTKIEEQENRRIEKNPELTFRYHRLTTFAGYIYFGDMTKKQRKKYEEIKKRKRSKEFGIETPKEESWIQKIYNAVVSKKLTKNGLLQACLIEGKKYSSITSLLNQMLTDNGINDTLKAFLLPDDNKDFHNNLNKEINDLIPDF